MNTLLNEMQRYLQVIERAEADPEVWGKLTEGTGIATANSYRAALAAAQPVAPEQAPTAAMVRKIMHEELAALSENATPCDDDEILLTKSSERIAARLASQQVKGYSVDEVRQAMMLMWADCGPNVKTVEAKQKASVILASLSAKGEAAHPSFDVIDKYGATHLIEKVPGTEVELSHLRHDQSVVSGDSKTFHYRLTKVDVDKGEAPKEDAVSPYEAMRGRDQQETDTLANTAERYLSDLRKGKGTVFAAPEATISAPVDHSAAHSNAMALARGFGMDESHAKCYADGLVSGLTLAAKAPITNSVDNSLSEKDANQNAVAASEGNLPDDGLTNDERLIKELREQAVAPSGVVEALGLVRRAQAIIQAFHVYKANPDTGIVMDWLHDAAALTQWEASQPSPDSPKN